LTDKTQALDYNLQILIKYKEEKHMRNMYLYAEIRHIDFDKLLSHIQDAEKPKTVLSGIASEIWKVALNPFIIKRLLKHPFVMKRIILGFAEEYGVTFYGLKVGYGVFAHNGESENCILNAMVLIDNINYSKLADVISDMLKSAGTKNNNHTVTEVLRIIKPFISETMETVPLSAIVELFELLAREKVIVLAQNCGITISDILLKGR